MSIKEKHVLGISGGKDSAALAVFMRQEHPEIDIDYFFTDTGKELPEVYEFLNMLEGFLGKPILKLNPDRDFDYWLKKNNTFLPSAQSRWCTKNLKIKPFEAWVKPFLDDDYSVFTKIIMAFLAGVIDTTWYVLASYSVNLKTIKNYIILNQKLIFLILGSILIFFSIYLIYSSMFYFLITN